LTLTEITTADAAEHLSPIVTATVFRAKLCKPSGWHLLWLQSN